MEKRTKKRLAGLIILAAIAVILAGCTATPDDSGRNQAGIGATVEGPFPMRSTAPPQIATATVAPIVTPPGTGSLGTTTLSPWGINTPDPSGFITPTATWGGGIISLTVSPSITPQPTSSVLKLGAEGPAVRSLQQRLKDLGYYKGSVDGDFGAGTESALKQFQSRNRLTVDGIAGPATLNRLNSSQALPPTPSPRPTPRVTPTPRPTATPRVNPNVFLRNGSTGADVRRLQERLIDLGYLSGNPTGRFNDVTEQAVYAFQRRNVSYADGIAGPMTLEKLYSSSARGTSSSVGVIGVTLERGMRDSAAVRRLQQRLKELRFYNGAVDGDFGISTETAVKDFQAANGLTTDGKAGETTLNRLFSSDANGAGSGTPRPPSAGTPTPIPFYVDVTPNPQGGYVTLREGNSGALVRNLQQALKDQGYFNLTVDGLYGVGTSDSVREFQRRKGLSQDGVAGPATQRILFEGNYPSGS
ncbi:MAG: peptidoglycan-binding protein [Eubacteriales bacterium]|nr:peptidoglycan-binding protein [Eubacteriales bacterium]NLO14262.1 peptidoglycan-binding protein [Clostridiales bacterium]